MKKMVIVKRNDDGMYQLWSGITDSKIHEDEWISKDDAKRILIECELKMFIKYVISIYMDFPVGHQDGDNHDYISNIPGLRKSYKWFHDALQSGCEYDDNIASKFKSIMKELKFNDFLVSWNDAFVGVLNDE